MAVTIFSDGRIIDSNGINLAPKTVVDKWRLTGSVSGNQNPLSSNLEGGFLSNCLSFLSVSWTLP